MAEQKKQLRLRPKAAFSLMLAGLAGLFLIAVSGFVPNDVHVEQKSVEEEWQVYEQQLETRLEALLGQVDGAGETIVMITLESSAENIYACDLQQNESEQTQEHILLETDSGQQALTQQVYLPQIQGVAVVCQGADDVRVNARLTELITAVLGITANRISIAKMAQ